MNRKVKIKTPPQGFWLDDTELPDSGELSAVIDRYLDDETGDIVNAVNGWIREYQQHQKSKQTEPSIGNEMADLRAVIEAVSELQTRLKNLPPKSLAMIEIMAAGTIHKTLGACDQLDTVLTLAEQKMAAYGREHPQTKPKLAGRDRLVCVLSDLYLANTEIRDPGDQLDFINATLKLVGEKDTIRTKSALNKILQNPPL